MKNYLVKRSFYNCMIFASLAIGLIFFATNHLDFIITTIEKSKFNLPNLAYILMRTCTCLFIPAFLLVPSLFEFGRIKTTRFLFILNGILYLITLTWIFYFLAENPISDLFVSRKGADFQNTHFVTNYVLWDNPGWLGSLCTLLYAIGLIYTGINFDDNCIKVRRCVIGLLCARIFLPMLCNILYGRQIISSFWLTNNYAELLSFTFLTIGIYAASLSDRSWVEYIWDQVSIDPEDEDMDFAPEEN